MQQQLLNTTHRKQQMTLSAPFKAKMDIDQFILIVDSMRSCRPITLLDAYELAEAIHKAMCHQRRYEDFKTFEQLYYRKNPMRRN